MYVTIITKKASERNCYLEKYERMFVSCASSWSAAADDLDKILREVRGKNVIGCFLGASASWRISAEGE